MGTSDDYSISTFLKQWDAGYYTNARESMIEAGWYDWFCEDHELFKRLTKMVPRVRAISESQSICKNWTHVSFSNCCGARLYDRFLLELIPPFNRTHGSKSISELYLIEMIEGHGKDPKNRPTLYTYKDGFQNPEAIGWRNIYAFFGVGQRKPVKMVMQIPKVPAFNRFAHIDLV